MANLGQSREPQGWGEEGESGEDLDVPAAFSGATPRGGAQSPRPEPEWHWAAGHVSPREGGRRRERVRSRAKAGKPVAARTELREVVFSSGKQPFYYFV